MGFQKSAVLRTEGRPAEAAGLPPGFRKDGGASDGAGQPRAIAMVGAHCTWSRPELKSQFLCP